MNKMREINAIVKDREVMGFLGNLPYVALESRKFCGMEDVWETAGLASLPPAEI